MGLFSELRLVVDVTAEISNNVDVHCIVKHFDYRVEGSNRCSIIWVKFTDSSIGKILQTKLARLYKSGICRSWTPILEITRMFKVHINGTYQVKRKQFPLQLSAAKTIHKSQGSTLTNAGVHFGSRNNDHMHYVGLSRVTCLENLQILHLNEKKIAVSTAVINEMRRLREECKLQFCVENLLNDHSTASIVSFFNIRSLHRHIHDLRKDVSVLASDIIFVSESHLMASDDHESVFYNDLHCM